jgi:hypothetical protein
MEALLAINSYALATGIKDKSLQMEAFVFYLLKPVVCVPTNNKSGKLQLTNFLYQVDDLV